MQDFTLTCTDGFTKTVNAATKEAAIDMLMADTEVQTHVQTSHPEMAGKTPEEMKAVVMDMVQPAAASEMPEEPAM